MTSRTNCSTTTAILMLWTALAAPATAGELERISKNAFQIQANGPSFLLTISGDGRRVAFSSNATNLAGPGDTNNQRDIFLRDQDTGTVTRINLGPGGVQADDISECPVISDDGSVVVYGSWASTIGGAPNTFFENIYLFDIATGMTERISKTPTGGFPNDGCSFPTVSGDGRFVTFLALASNIDLSNQSFGVFVYDRQTQVMTRVTKQVNGAPADGTLPNISADGQYIAFQSDHSNLVVGDTNLGNDIFRYSQQTGVIELVSVSSSGQQANGPCVSGGIGTISADGRFIVFESFANNLVSNDVNNARDIFVRDMLLGTTERVSQTPAGVGGNSDSSWAVISRDGRYVAFESLADNLAPGSIETNGFSDVFLHDRVTKRTVRVSTANSGAEGNLGSFAPAIDGRGRYVGFYSVANNLVGSDTNGVSDLFVHSQCWVEAETVGAGFPGTGGVVPKLIVTEGACFQGSYQFDLHDTLGGAAGVLFAGTGLLNQLVLGANFFVDLSGPFVAFPVVLSGPSGVAGAGSLSLNQPDLHLASGLSLVMQLAVADPAAAFGASMSNAIQLDIGE